MVINWTITQLNRQTSDGFVTSAHWNAAAIDENFMASVYNTCGWPVGEPTIPYDELTQDIVLNWIWANGVDKDATEANLASQIELKKNPISATGLPW
jgi:hypothetical protein